MKKKVAKVFKMYGGGKIEIIKDYTPSTKKEKTTAIVGTQRDINRAIGNILLKGHKQEKKMIGELLIGDYFEDRNPEGKIIKY